MSYRTKEIKRRIKESKKQIDAEEEKKYKERTAKVDKKIDKMAEKAKTKKDFLFKVDPLKVLSQVDSYYRGILWLIQAFIEFTVGWSLSFYLVTTAIPIIGNMIGHINQVRLNSPTIDIQNAMTTPTLLAGMFIMFLDILFLKYLWRFMNVILGRLRAYSKYKHHRNY